MPCLIPAKTGNKFITISVHNDKLLETVVSWIMTFEEVTCTHKFFIGTSGRRLIDYKETLSLSSCNSFLKYQPSGEGGTRSPPAMPHRLQNPKWPLGAPKWPTRSGQKLNLFIFSPFPNIIWTVSQHNLINFVIQSQHFLYTISTLS